MLRTDADSLQDQEMRLPLASIDISTLSSDKVIYYFGVLATQALLLPKFQCSSSKRGTWKCRMQANSIRAHV